MCWRCWYSTPNTQTGRPKRMRTSSADMPGVMVARFSSVSTCCDETSKPFLSKSSMYVCLPNEPCANSSRVPPFGSAYSPVGPNSACRACAIGVPGGRPPGASVAQPPSITAIVRIIGGAMRHVGLK